MINTKLTYKMAEVDTGSMVSNAAEMSRLTSILAFFVSAAT